MKKINLVIVALFSIFFLNAQGKKDFGPPVASVYRAKVYHFKTLPVAEDDIVFMGNSITAGVDWAELLKNPKIKNRGIPGDNSFGILARLSDVTKGKPSKLFMLIGTNDLSAKVPNETILENYERIIRQIQKESPKTKIYIQAILPINLAKLKTNRVDKVENIKSVNNALKDLCKRMDITFIDLYASFSKNDVLPEEYTYDGLHLNIRGYFLWRKALHDGKYI